MLDKPFPGFEHASLGPLPIDPRLTRFESETLAWKKKYNEIYNEQCKARSLETSLRNQLHEAILERDKFKAMVEAQRDIIQWMIANERPELSK